jgi:thymidylate synthase
MKQYLDLCQRVLDEGVIKPNRTGVNTIGIHGAMMQFDLRDGFPAVTTKKLAYKSCFAEMLGFLRGYDNAAQFRELGCKVWNANANENKQWLGNPYREGEDDLGRIYGVQARDWRGNARPGHTTYVDQLAGVVRDLSDGIDNRREIVTHWNPAEMNQMALPPCHLLYQFGIQPAHDIMTMTGRGDESVLNLSMYQRSCDLPLGVPFNIAGYAWLLSVIAKITGHRAGVFTHFLHDVHIYENQIEDMKEQLKREPLSSPTLAISPGLETLADLETMASPGDFQLLNYEHHPAIKYAFAV